MSTLTNLFAKLKANFITASVAYIALGIVLVIFPAQVAGIACYILGALLIAAGLLMIVNFFTMRGISSLFSITLAAGIITAAVGIFIIVRSDTVLKIVPFIIGVIAVIDGLVGLQRSVLLGRCHFSTWWLSLVFSLATLILGVVIAINPFESAIFMFRFIGICLIFTGIVDIWGIHSFNKYTAVPKDDFVIENSDTEK